MATSATKLIPGCYCAEAMGFKVWQYNGETLCCAELVLQDYGSMPEEVSAYFRLINKKDGAINQYGLKEINDFGLAVGSKRIANADEQTALGWVSAGHKERLMGVRCYLWTYNKVLPTGFKLSVFSVLPLGEYPSLDKVYKDDDIDMEIKTVEQTETKKATLEPLPFEAGSDDVPF